MRNIISKFLFTLLALSLGFGQVWGDTVISLQGTTTAASKKAAQIGSLDAYFGRCGNSVSLSSNGLATGNSSIFVAFKVAEKSEIILTCYCTASSNYSKEEYLSTVTWSDITNMATTEVNSTPAKAYFETTYDTKTITYDKNTQKEIEYNVSLGEYNAGAYAVYLKNSINSGFYIRKITLKPSAVTKHSVTYALNGGTGTTPTQEDVAEGSKFTLHDGVTGITAPTDKEFDGWHDGTTKYAGGAEYTMGTSDVTLTAQWRNETVKYAITYDVNGGESATPTSPNKAAGDVFSLAAAPTRTGYDFLGWKCNIDDVTYAAGASYTMTAAATTFTAQWKKAPTVIYYWQSSYSSSPTQDSPVDVTGGTIEWKSDDSGKSWGNESYNKGSNVVPEDLQVASGKKAVKSGGNAVYAVLTLSGSEKFKAGDTIYVGGYNSWMFSSSKQRYNGETPSDDPTKPMSGDIANIATGGTSNSTYNYNYAVIPDGIDISTMYVIRGVGSGSSIAAIKVIRPVKYAVNFAAGTGASGSMAAKEYPAGAEVTLPECTFTAPTDQEFDAWTSSDVTITAGKFTMPANDVTITATWKAETPKYDIVYHAGANGTGSIAAAKKTKDIDFVLSSERFTRAGFLQTGWATADGGAQAYALGGTYTENAALNLYPVWTELDTYVAPFECATSAPAGWTFANAGSHGASDATVDYECQFGSTCPATGDSKNDNYIAFAKSPDVYATYDLGIATTVAAVTGIFYVGSSSARTFTIDYIGADESTVLHTITVNHPASSNWGVNNVNETAVIDNVRYIKVKGMASNQSWIIMSAFSVSYIETRTKYDVTFAAGTGASGSMDALHYIEGAEVVLPACTFTAPTDMEFDAWTSSDVTITDGKFTMPASNVTITATWKDAVTRFNVTFETNGGSTIPAQEVEENGHPTAVPDPTKDNYVFAGWFNNADLADIHAVADITALTITEDITLYAKWALDVKATKIVFSNTFDAFIDVAHNTISAFYMAGESAPTIASYIGTNIKAFPDGIVIEGNKIVLVGTDDSRMEFDLVLEAVTPLSTLEAEQTFDGTENYVKSAYGWKGDSKGWAFQKVNDADDRETKGLTREYFFFGPAKSASFVWKVSKKNSGDACVAKVYVNGTEVMDALTDNFEVTLNKNTANMVAIVSQQHNGDCGLASVKLNADYNRTEMLGAGVLGTICLDHNVPVATAQGASFYELVGKNDIGKIAFDEVVSGDLEAGVPYVFQADGDLIALLYGATSVTEPDNSGALKGTFTGETFTAEQAAANEIYFFRDRALWSAKETGLKVLANRAWLEMGSVNPVSSPNPAPGRRRIVLGTNGTNVATGIDDVQDGVRSTKMLIDGRLFILRGDKIYDATGRLVK